MEEKIVLRLNTEKQVAVLILSTELHFVCVIKDLLLQ